MRIMAGSAVTIVHRGVNRFARLNFTIQLHMTKGTGCPLVLFHTERIGKYFCPVTERTLSLNNGAVEEFFYPGSKPLVALMRYAGRRVLYVGYIFFRCCKRIRGAHTTPEHEKKDCNPGYIRWKQVIHIPCSLFSPG
jgi:hypothetical protein